MKYTKEQIDFIKNCGKHFEVLTGGRGYSKTKQIIEQLEKLQQELTDYKERNKKAFKYIKDRIYIPTEEDDVWFEQFISLSDKELDDLLEILDKKDKE